MIASPTRPNWGLNLQPRNMPRLGIEPFGVQDDFPTISHTGQGDQGSFIAQNSFVCSVG